jgi:tRNA (guanosine-2'-O-)-methyltransferase
MAFGCGGGRPDARSVPASAVSVTNVTPPTGIPLAQGCMPTGPELCFNAIDDNCNGVIDEGCGEETGVLQFTIAWDEAAADVNLTLQTPSHETIAKPLASSRSGCVLDRDCPGPNGCRGQNIENIHCDSPEPAPGHYTAEIALVRLNGAPEPLTVHFGARLGGHTTGFEAELSTDDPKKTFSFDVR